MKNALILGGSRGIGRALYDMLSSTPEEWQTIALGHADYNILAPSNRAVFDLRQTALDLGGYDVFVYCAGDLTVTGLDAFRFAHEFYNIITSHGGMILRNGCKIVVVSSVAVANPAKLNPDYAAAKAALEHYAMTIASSQNAIRHGWTVQVRRFDLVATDMLKCIPADLKAGRTIISATDAAKELYELL